MNWKWKELSKIQAAERINIMYNKNGNPTDYKFTKSKMEKELGKQLCSAYSYAIDKNNNNRDYSTDLFFGLKLYAIFNGDTFHMTLSDAANNDIWRYICVSIVPNIIMDRWHKEGAPIPIDHFYTKPNRIYLKSLWWYIHLSWQDSEDETEKILRHNSTDTILNLVERSGQLGYQIDLYRAIMYKFSCPDSPLKAHDAALFRKIMKLNTAKVTNIEPALCAGGINGYVKELFAYFI
jgi:hypothetical protein